MNIQPTDLYQMPMKVNNQPSDNIGLFLGLIRVAYLTKTERGSYEIMLGGSTNQHRVDYVAGDLPAAVGFVCRQLNWDA